VISHGSNSRRTDRSRFELEFGWTGTGDPTPMLCVPVAIDAMAAIVSEVAGPFVSEGEAWNAIMDRNRALALQAREIVADAIGAQAPVPESMIGSIATLDLPARSEPPALGSTRYHDPLQDELLKHGIQVPIVPWPDQGVRESAGLPRSPAGEFRRAIRVSAQLYNAPLQYAHLGEILAKLT
jgi:isopenicillin-N epimerase